MNKRNMISNFLKKGFDTKRLKDDATHFTIVLEDDEDDPNVDIVYSKYVERNNSDAVTATVELDKPAAKMPEYVLLNEIYEEFAFLLALEDTHKEYNCTITENIKSNMTITARNEKEAEKIIQEMYENGETKLLTSKSDINVSFKCKRERK